MLAYPARPRWRSSCARTAAGIVSQLPAAARLYWSGGTPAGQGRSLRHRPGDAVESTRQFFSVSRPERGRVGQLVAEDLGPQLGGFVPPLPPDGSPLRGPRKVVGRIARSVVPGAGEAGGDQWSLAER